MAKKAAGKGRADLPVGQDAQQIESFFKRSHKVIVALTVKEILDEQISKKLV
jgi:hypothetical protein